MCKSVGKALGHIISPVTKLVFGNGGGGQSYTAPQIQMPAPPAPPPTAQAQSQTDISDIEAERKRKRRVGFDSTQSPMTILGNFGTSADDTGKRTLG